MVRGRLQPGRRGLKPAAFCPGAPAHASSIGPVSAVQSKASGDDRITLDDGRVVIGSRRYRDAAAAGA